MKENVFGESLRIVVSNHINKIKNHENTTLSIFVKSAVHRIKFIIITRMPREELRHISRHVVI
jgi:hypothetical protein